MNVQECRRIGKPTKRSNVRRAIRERNIKRRATTYLGTLVT